MGASVGALAEELAKKGGGKVYAAEHARLAQLQRRGGAGRDQGGDRRVAAPTWS